MAIALSGLVKAALAWRAGEKEMIGGWAGGGEGSFVFVLVLYSVFAWILYFVHMCVVGGREGYFVFVLCICICMISVGGWVYTIHHSSMCCVPTVLVDGR